MKWIPATERLPIFSSRTISRFIASQIILFDAQDFAIRNPQRTNEWEWLDESEEQSLSTPAADFVMPTDHDIKNAADKYMDEYTSDFPPAQRTCFAAGVKWLIKSMVKRQFTPSVAGGRSAASILEQHIGTDKYNDLPATRVQILAAMYEYRSLSVGEGKEEKKENEIDTSDWIGGLPPNF